MWSLHAEKNDLYEELNMLITGFNKKMYIKTSCCIILSITVNKTDREGGGNWAVFISAWLPFMIWLSKPILTFLKWILNLHKLSEW
jgi:hypothetical protein